MRPMSRLLLMSWVSRIRPHKDPKRISVLGHIFAKYEVMNFLPPILVVASVLALKLCLALTDPVLRAIDPWVWAQIVENYSSEIPIAYYTPKGYQLLATLVALATRTSGYEVVRFYPIIAALNLVPMYFLSFLISKSHRVATVTIVLVNICKWYSIRTSIGNPECFTHFWFAFSMVFLLLLRDQPTRRNIGGSVGFLTVTVLFWQFPIAIYAVFIPLLCVAHFHDRPYRRRLVLIAISSAVVAGSLWYFWAAPTEWISLAQTTISSLSSPAMANSSPDLVGSWGYVLLFLGIVGFVYTFARPASRQDPPKVFLATYFLSTVVVIVASLFSSMANLVYYGFSSLALPFSIFAAIGIVSAVDTVTPALERWTATLPRQFGHVKGEWSRTLVLLAIIIVMVASSSPSNYRGNTVYKYWYEPVYYDQIVGTRIPFLDEQSSRWIATFQYGKSFDAPSNDLYSALTWIRNHSSKQSCVSAFLIRPSSSNSPYEDPEPYSVLRRAFLTISERNLTEPTEFGSLLPGSLTEFRSRILEACGGDVYFVTGIHSWSGEEWADTRLESRFLSCAAQSSEAFPEGYSVGEVRVFHIIRGAVSLLAGASCQAECDSYRMIRWRLARHRGLWANEFVT